MFYLTNNNDQGWADLAFPYGWTGPSGKPIAGDWNSDGIDTIGLFNTSNGHFYLRNANSEGIADLVFPFGNTTDTPIAGNWDGQPLMLPPTPTPTSTPDPGSPLNASFVYDGDGRRVKSAITTGSGTTTTFFVGAHYEVANGVVTKYYYAGAQRIAMRTNSTLKFLLGDHLGSTSLTTTSSGNVISELRYKAWGEVRYASGSTPTDYTYTGQYSDSYINLLWYGSRHYDPELGRFINPDSIVPVASQGVQAWDRYAYVNNAPTNYTDPSGHGVDCGTGMGCVTPYRPKNKGQDVTEWLQKELNNQLDNVLYPYDCYGGLECPFARFGNLYGSHLSLFGNYGRYDIKREMLKDIGHAVILCGSDGCRWVDYSAPGNIMYGYFSAARGVPQKVSWTAAGMLEIKDWTLEGNGMGEPFLGEANAWFDTPGDKAAVDFGYSLYESHPDGITLAEFMSALTTDVLSTFQKPTKSPLRIPMPQNNSYPPGYFLDPVRPD